MARFPEIFVIAFAIIAGYLGRRFFIVVTLVRGYVEYVAFFGNFGAHHFAGLVAFRTFSRTLQQKKS